MSMQHKLLAGAGALAIALALSPTVASARGGGGMSGTATRGASTMGSGGVHGTTITGSMIPSHATFPAARPTASPATPNPVSTRPNVTEDFQHRTLDPPGGNDSGMSSPSTHAPLAQPNAPQAVPQTQPNAPTTHPMGLGGDESGSSSLPTHPQMTQPHTTLQPLARPNAPLTHPAAPDMQHRTLDPPGGN